MILLKYIMRKHNLRVVRVPLWLHADKWVSPFWRFKKLIFWFQWNMIFQYLHIETVVNSPRMVYWRTGYAFWYQGTDHGSAAKVGTVGTAELKLSQIEGSKFGDVDRRTRKIIYMIYDDIVMLTLALLEMWFLEETKSFELGRGCFFQSSRDWGVFFQLDSEDVTLEKISFIEWS